MKEPPTKPEPDNDHGEDGRFKKGCKGGPGNPHVTRLSEYRDAIREAVTPEHLKLVMKRLVQLSVRDGDTAAIRILLDRCLGKADLIPAGEPLQLEVTELRSFDDVAQFADRLLAAAASGSVPANIVRQLSSLVEMLRKVFETEDLERRVSDIENGVSTAKHAASLPPRPSPEPEQPGKQRDRKS